MALMARHAAWQRPQRASVPTNTTETVAEDPGDATVVRWKKVDDVSLRAIGVQLSFVNRVDCGRHDLFIF